MNIRDKIILITGGGSGIGLALARGFIAHSNRVIICGRDLKKLESVRSANPELTIYQCDITDQSAVNRMAAEITKDFGYIDILINNAGSSEITDILRDQKILSQAEREMQQNYFGALNVIEHFLPILRKSQEPTIVNVSSAGAYAPIPIFGAYCAAKAALHSYTRSLRSQLKPIGIKVFEVLPPSVDTNLNSQLAEQIGSGNSGNMVISPEKLAAVAIKKMRHNVSEIRVGQTKFVNLLERISPKIPDALFNRIFANYFKTERVKASGSQTKRADS